MTQELYKRYRPKGFKGVFGQEAAVKMLEGFVSRKDGPPHSLLLTGPSGTGKTTCARILKKRLNCSDMDFHELNCASFRGIQTVRDIDRIKMQAPVGGKVRIWLIDEAHQLTRDAQDAFLKILEDTPKHCYFMLATTEPAALINTIITRCAEVKFKAIPDSKIEALLREVAEKEGFALSDDVCEKIIDCADGSARHALVSLDKILTLEDEEDQLEAITREGIKQQAVDLAKTLLFGNKPKWPDVSKVRKMIDKGQAESVRRIVLGFTAAVMLNNKAPARCAQVLDAFENNFYDSGYGGLCLASWKALTGG